MRVSHAGTRGVVAQFRFRSPVRAPRSIVIVVLHLPANARSVLRDILTRAGELPAGHPRDREPLVAGQAYVAPPDRHSLVHDDMLRLTVGPWENGHRPSVDGCSGARRAGTERP